MNKQTTRRRFMAGTGLAAAAAMAPLSGLGRDAFAQTKPKLRFSAVFSEQDIRAEMMKQFADATKDDFTFEGFYGGNLFKQGTELVALQRGNLEMGNIAPQDIANQIPAWSILTAGYLFRDAEHLKKVFQSDVGKEMMQLAEDQLGIKILGPVYFGVRQVGLKPDKSWQLFNGPIECRLERFEIALDAAAGEHEPAIDLGIGDAHHAFQQRLNLTSDALAGGLGLDAAGAGHAQSPHAVEESHGLLQHAFRAIDLCAESVQVGLDLGQTGEVSLGAEETDDAVGGVGGAGDPFAAGDLLLRAFHPRVEAPQAVEEPVGCRVE